MQSSKWRRIALAAAVSVAGAGATATSAFAHGHITRHDHYGRTGYEFQTLDNQNDPTFNQLLGINQHGVIAGYFGSGAQNHPNKGYLLSPRYNQDDYMSENYPGSVQTQVTGLNDRGVRIGFWSDQNNANQVNDNFGFWEANGQFHNVNFPTPVPTSVNVNNLKQAGLADGNQTPPNFPTPVNVNNLKQAGLADGNQTPRMNQLLGVNDHDIAVGFYVDANGNNHGYTYDLNTNTYHEITIPGASSVTLTGINNRGDISGFETDSAGVTHAFLLRHHGVLTIIDSQVSGTTSTQALGVNDEDELVGVYTVGSGSTAQLHGFTWTRNDGLRTVDDPNGMGTTTINGVNDRGQLVGFYVDSAGNTDGLLATPTND